MLPLLFTLFFGRTFCGSVCPLGALQDVVLLRSVSLPVWLASSLRLCAYIYLALAVAGIKPGDEIIIPAQTFIATGLVALMQPTTRGREARGTAPAGSPPWGRVHLASVGEPPGDTSRLAYSAANTETFSTL